MKIERIDDKTVKCFLSNEELEEYDIDYKDFVTLLYITYYADNPPGSCGSVCRSRPAPPEDSAL